MTSRAGRWRFRKGSKPPDTDALMVQLVCSLMNGQEWRASDNPDAFVTSTALAGIVIESDAGWFRLSFAASSFCSDLLAKNLAQLHKNAVLDSALLDAIDALEPDTLVPNSDD